MFVIKDLEVDMKFFRNYNQGNYLELQLKRKNQPEDHTMGVLADYSLPITTKDRIFSFSFFY